MNKRHAVLRLRFCVMLILFWVIMMGAYCIALIIVLLFGDAGVDINVIDVNCDCVRVCVIHCDGCDLFNFYVCVCVLYGTVPLYGFFVLFV